MKRFIPVIAWVSWAALAAAGTPAPTNTPTRVAPLATLDANRIRTLAAEAIRQKYPGIELGAFTPSYTIYMESASTGTTGVVVADWLGKDALAVEKGKTPELDSRKVRKLRVRLSTDGEILDVADLEVWISRNLAAPGPAPAPPKVPAP